MVQFDPVLIFLHGVGGGHGASLPQLKGEEPGLSVRSSDFRKQDLKGEGSGWVIGPHA